MGDVRAFKRVTKLGFQGSLAADTLITLSGPNWGEGPKTLISIAIKTYHRFFAHSITVRHMIRAACSKIGWALYA